MNMQKTLQILAERSSLKARPREGSHPFPVPAVLEEAMEGLGLLVKALEEEDIFNLDL